MSIIQRIRAHSFLPILGISLGSMELKRVPPALTVSVTHDGAPIAGIEVTVIPVTSNGPVFTGITDARGQVNIRDLATGKYFLAASHLGFEAGKEWIDVVAAADADTTSEFHFEWNSDYQTQRIAGTLSGMAPGSTGNDWMDLVHPVKAVYGGVAITVRNAFGTNEYRTFSNRNGVFAIDDVPEGIYVLTIEGGEQGSGGTADITRRLVDVKSSAPLDRLRLELRETGSYHTEFELSEK